MKKLITILIIVCVLGAITVYFNYDDYVEHGGESGAKDAGKWRLEGKDYIMQEGDVVHFRFNV